MATAARGQFDFVQLFARSVAELKKLAPKAIRAARHDALLWASYPKKTSGVASDLSCNSGFGPMYDAGFDSVAIIAVDPTWSAIRFRPVDR